MFDKIISWFKKDKLPSLTGYIYNAERHRSWGNAINFDSKEHKPGEYSIRASGHLSRKPKNGDIIESKTKSGAIAQWLVFNVKYVGSPHDMWFSDIGLHKYIDKFSEPIKSKSGLLL